MNITHDIEIKLSEKYDIEWCSDYGEPGYSLNGDKGICFANWNNIPSYVSSCLEKHYQLEWSDEWYIDYNRSLCYRTSPDSYSWTPSVIFWDGEPFTIDDANDDPIEYLEMLENNATRCDIFKVLNATTCKELGYELITEEYESGWYHKNDDPQEILEQLLDDYPEDIFVFGNISQEQFRINFSVYRKIAE